MNREGAEEAVPRMERCALAMINPSHPIKSQSCRHAAPHPTRAAEEKTMELLSLTAAVRK